MVILKSQFHESDVPLLNVYVYNKFAPDMKVGDQLNPNKITSAFHFLQRSLSLGSSGSSLDEHAFNDLLKECFPDLSDFILSSPIANATAYCSIFPMKIFIEVFEIMLTSDFAQIFRTIGLEAEFGFPSLHTSKLVPRSGEEVHDGNILNAPAEDHLRNVLQSYINAGSSDMMITSTGTASFIQSMDQSDTDSENTGPYPIIASPADIIQARR